MSSQRSDENQTALTKLLQESGLGADALLYREAERAALTPTETPGVFRLAANAHPRESVLDAYGPGYVVQADTMGPGLAFAESTAPNWQETAELRTLQANRTKVGGAPATVVEVEVRLKDLLDQGGLMYPVESVTVERAWYFTLPAGSVKVRMVM